MSYAHPGSIQVQVGRLWDLIALNIEQEDTPGVENAVRALKAAVSPYTSLYPTLEERYREAGPKDLNDWAGRFECAMVRVEIMMYVLWKHNLYGYNVTSPEDASDLAMVEIPGMVEEIPA